MRGDAFIHFVSGIRRVNIRLGVLLLIPKSLQIPKEVRIEYCLKKFEHFSPRPLKRFKCLKCGHHNESYRGRPTYIRCGQKDTDYMEEDFSNENKCSNCLENHPAFSKTCNIYKREKEIIELKYRRNIKFLEEWKIDECYVKI